MLLGELFVKGQVISQQQLDDALVAQRAYGGLLGEHLLRQRVVSEESLRYYLHQQSALLLEEENTFSRLRLIRDLFKRFCTMSPSYVSLCLLFLFLSVCLSLTFPFYVKLIFDVLIFARDLTAIVYLSLFVLTAQVFARWFLFHASQLFNITNVAFSGWLRRALYQKIALMRYATYIRYGSGDLLNRVTTDVDNVLTRWEHVFINFFKNCFSVLISVAVLMFIDPWLTLGVLLLSMLIIIVPGQVSNRANAALSRRPGFQSQVVSLLKDQLYGFKLLKAFNLQHSALHRLGTIFDEYYLNDHRMVKYWNLAFNLRSILGYSLSGLVLFVGGYNVMQGSYSLGDLALFILTVNMLAPYTDEFMLLIIEVNDIKRYWKRCVEILQLNVDEQRFQRDDAQYDLTGAIHLDRVTFGYGDKFIFRDLTLDIEMNKSYGVIGRSGSGKSTLLKLLVKDVLPHQGRICYDTHDITGLSEHTLAWYVSSISQSPLLFPDTVYENIKLGVVALRDSEPSEDEIYAAAQMSGIHQRVINLPQGYQTIVGEGAYQLSGGEKQRIAIARALMKAPKVFLFDEPTSALDSDNERLVLSSMKALMGRHTILICTHNMRLLEDVDYIICVDGDYTHVLRRNDVSSEELTAMLDTTSDSSTSVAQV